MAKVKLYKYVLVKYLPSGRKYTFLYPDEEIMEGEKLLIVNNLNQIKVQVLEIFECPRKTDFKYKKLDVLEHLDCLDSKKITDSKLLEKMVVNHPENFDLASDELKNDKELVLKLLNFNNLVKKSERYLVINDGYKILEYIGDELKNDKDFALSVVGTIVNNDTNYLQYLGDNVLNDKDVIFKALEYEELVDTNVYKFIGNKLKFDKDFCFELISKKYNYFPLLEDSVKNDYDFAYRVISREKYSFMIKYLNKELRSNKDLIKLVYEDKYAGWDKEFYIYVSERKNNEFYYPKNSNIMNKIIIDKNYANLLLKEDKRTKKLKLDFTLLVNSEDAEKCNEEYKNYIDYFKLEEVGNTYEITFYSRNKEDCFRTIVKEIFINLKDKVYWNFEKYELLRHDEYHVDWGKYPQEVVHLFYDDGLIADEYFLNQGYVKYN